LQSGLVISLDERKRIANVVLAHALAIGKNPLERNFLFDIRGFSKGDALILDLIGVGGYAFESDHLVRCTVNGRTNGSYAGRVSFFDIDFGR